MWFSTDSIESSKKRARMSRIWLRTQKNSRAILLVSCQHPDELCCNCFLQCYCGQKIPKGRPPDFFIFFVECTMWHLISWGCAFTALDATVKRHCDYAKCLCKNSWQCLNLHVHMRIHMPHMAMTLAMLSALPHSGLITHLLVLMQHRMQPFGPESARLVSE